MATHKEFTSREQIERARQMRADKPKAEAILWSRLRGQQTGYKFRRQHPIGPYFADFACVATKLVVELDGESHDERVLYDQKRDEYLKQCGWRVVRYWNLDALRNTDEVVNDIVRHCTPAAPT